eukprot:GFUD01014398.1.p1 GENE.GFUD01014398.1~~GFUD01014398.1.p1  ORF type:complete len:296 (-),score=64.73 GFUD01014398.1:523-1410(-)
MDPLPVRTEQFTLEDDIDDEWAVRAETIVNEPSDEEEVKAKVEDARRKLIEIYPDANTEDIFTEKNIIKYLRSANWNVVDAMDMFLTSVQQFKDFLPFITAGSPSQLEKVWSKKLVWVSPKRDQWGRRVLIFRLGRWNPSDFSVQHLYTATFSLLQMISLEAVTQVAGVVFVADLQGFGFKHLKALGVEELRCLGSFLSGGFPMWFRKLHIVNNPRLFNMLYSILKGFLGPRIKDNVQFHGYQLPTLLEAVPAEILPKDLGGQSNDADIDLSVETLKTNEVRILAIMEQLKYLSL